MTSMSGASAHQSGHGERLFREAAAFLRDSQQIFRGHQHAVVPVELTKALFAESHSDIRAIDFEVRTVHIVFWKAKRIGRALRLFLHSHRCNSPHRLPREALGNCGMTVVYPTLKFHSININSTMSCGVATLFQIGTPHNHWIMHSGAVA
jgi:hypothetical protein